MIEGTVHFLLLVLEHVPRPWNFTRDHVNDFSEMGNVGSWEVHDWPKWTSTIGTMQVTPACILIKHDMTPSLDAK